MAFSAHSPSGVSPPRDAAAVMLISGTAIAYQIVLMRIFSIAHWHHFAYLMISVAMLGFGASGTLLSILRPWLAGRERGLFIAATAGFGLAMVIATALSPRIPFETFHLISDPKQFWYLLGLSLLLAVPFLLAATAIATSLILHPRRIGWMYGMNMTGSAVGAGAVLALLFLLPPHRLPIVLVIPIAMAVILAGGLRTPLRLGCVILFGAGTFAGILATPRNMEVSDYKILSYLRQFPDFSVAARTQSPLSVIEAVTSSMIRETPGQVSNYPFQEKGPFPRQAGLVMDAGSLSAVHHYEGHLEPFAFMDYVTAAAPYHLLEAPRVLVLGAGGGSDVLIALVGGASHVTAVEMDPKVKPLLDGPLRDTSGGLFDRPDVTYHVAEGRGFLASNPMTYDLIQVALLDAFTAAASGVYALSESYLYTREAVEHYLSRLEPNGILAITRWIKTPARDEIKLFATLVEALEHSGVDQPGLHLAFLRSWNTATLLVSRSPWTESQLADLRAFCRDRWFDLSYLPGLGDDEINRYILLEDEIYAATANEILFGDREEFYRTYPFHVRPATDDRPHFFQFFRWRSLPLLIDTFGWSWIAYMEWGYVALLVAMAQGLIASAVLILFPLLLLRRRQEGQGARGHVFIYFGCLGLAFMFLEIAMIQKFMLFLAYPIYAVAVVLTSFLLFAGLGSLCADRLHARAVQSGWLAILFLGTIGLFYTLFLPAFFASNAAAWPDSGKIAVSVLLLAPMAFAMGMPFPLGLQWVSGHRAELVPWAWGINGFASVVGASLATFTAIHVGFRLLVVLSVVLYLVAAWMLARMIRGDDTKH